MERLRFPRCKKKPESNGKSVTLPTYGNGITRLIGGSESVFPPTCDRERVLQLTCSLLLGIGIGWYLTTRLLQQTEP